MRRLLPPLLLAMTACTGGTASSGPAMAPASPAVAAPMSPTPVAIPVDPAEHVEIARPRATLTGTVTYSARIALTPEAEVQVELRDVSFSDLEAPLIAKHVIQRPGQVPIAFALEYDPSSIFPDHQYAISARIADRGQLQFVTDTPIPVFGSAAPDAAKIVVVPVQ